MSRVGESDTARASAANIWKSLWWPCATSLDQPQDESSRRPQTILAHSGRDRPRVLACPRPSKSECHAPRSRAVLPSPRHQGVLANLLPPRLPSPFASRRQSYFDFSCIHFRRRPQSHPGWDGVETIGQLWKCCPDLQIVVCSAYSDYSWEKMIRQLGHSPNLVVLQKPFDNIEVLQLAHALTEK